VSSKPLYMTGAMEEAWAAYLRGLEEVRQIIFNHRFAEGQRERNEAHYLFQQVQAEAFHVAIAPRPDYPRFYSLFDPMTFTWGIPNPDFIYARTYLDGRRTYRIRGRRGNSLFVLIQALNAHLTLPRDRLKLLGEYDLDALRIADDGSFGLIASATAHDGNWIELDPKSDRNFILVREAFVDWSSEQRTEMHVEVIDDLEPRPIVYDEAEMIRRLEDAMQFMKTLVAGVSIKGVEDVVTLAGGWNRFAVPKFSGAAAAATNATYNVLAYQIGPDEALVIELDPPNPRYWGIQVGDSWNQAIDYASHQSSLNMYQGTIDTDGRIRAVICHRDPGIRNWLTPVDSRRGTIMVRWYFAQGTATAVTARLVPYVEIDQHLPRDAARITPEARHTELKRRQRAIERRFAH
jgi:hypothetical protein